MLYPREESGTQEWLCVQGTLTYVSSKSLPLLGIMVGGLSQPIQRTPNAYFITM
jgi:hypothetical protein